MYIVYLKRKKKNVKNSCDTVAGILQIRLCLILTNIK